MSLMDPATHKIRLNSEQCATCIGNPRAGVALRPGRMRELVRANTGDGKMGLVCHATIVYDEDGEPSGGDQALCKWFYEQFGHLVNGVRVMHRLGGFTEVPPPPRKGTPAVPPKLSERLIERLRRDGQDLPPCTVLERTNRNRRTGTGSWSWFAYCPGDCHGDLRLGSHWSMRELLAAPRLTYQKLDHGDICVDPAPDNEQEN